MAVRKLNKGAGIVIEYRREWRMRFGLIFLVVTAFALRLHAAENVWGDLSWGMDRDAVLAAHPQAIVQGEMLIIDAGEIAKVPFGAYLTFGGENGGLSEIRLDCMLPQVTDDMAVGVISAVKAELGPPTHEDREAFMNFVWERSIVTINMIWAPETDYSPSLLRIFYRMPKPAQEAASEEP